jgi:putative ABC transport system ATP-binding protein
MPLIHLENLNKVFTTDEVETHALSGIHLEIERGEFVSIAGPSGCGKSTLLAILGLLDSPSDGRYLLNGNPVERLRPAERARIRNREIGFIFQAFNLIGDLTVFENVELPLTYRHVPGSERRKMVRAALEKVGMSHRHKHYPSQLSGGQQQRVVRGAGARRRAVDPAGGRADRQSRFRQWRSRYRHSARTPSLGRDHLHGDARSALCAGRGPHGANFRRAGGGGAGAGGVNRHVHR